MPPTRRLCLALALILLGAAAILLSPMVGLYAASGVENYIIQTDLLASSSAKVVISERLPLATVKNAPGLWAMGGMQLAALLCILGGVRWILRVRRKAAGTEVEFD